MSIEPLTAVHVPERFTNHVVGHVLRCLMVDPVFGGSQILAIVGSPGGGKTFQLTKVLQEAGVSVVTFSAADAEDPDANVPVQRLRARFASVQSSVSTARPAALVFDDVDLLLGRYEDTQYTHNLQHLLGTLMAVASSISIDNATAAPVPMFMVGNDLSVIHHPVLRAGRARILRWEPTHDEVTAVVAAMFPMLALDECERLTRRHAHQPVAFFAAVRDALVDDYLTVLMRDQAPAELLLWAAETRAEARPQIEYALGDLLDTADRIAGTVSAPATLARRHK